MLGVYENAGCTDLCGENDDSPMALGLSQSVQMSLSKTRVPQDSSAIWGYNPPFAHKPKWGRKGFPASTIVSQASMQGEEDGRKRNTKKRWNYLLADRQVGLSENVVQALAKGWGQRHWKVHH